MSHVDEPVRMSDGCPKSHGDHSILRWRRTILEGWPLSASVLLLLVLSRPLHAADPPLSVNNNGFLGLRLGMTVADAARAGATPLVREGSTVFAGDVFKSAYLPEEPEGTHKRTLYFQPQFGLYRVRYEIGDARFNDSLPADEVFARWQQLFSEVRNSNPSAYVLSSSIPDVNDMRIDVLQQCQSGPEKLRAALAPLSTGQVLQYLNEHTGSTPGQVCSLKCMWLALMCGGVKPMHVQWDVGSDKRISIDSIVTGSGVVLALVFENARLSQLMRSQ